MVVSLPRVVGALLPIISIARNATAVVDGFHDQGTRQPLPDTPEFRRDEISEPNFLAEVSALSFTPPNATHCLPAYSPHSEEFNDTFPWFYSARQTPEIAARTPEIAIFSHFQGVEALQGDNNPVDFNVCIASPPPWHHYGPPFKRPISPVVDTTSGANYVSCNYFAPAAGGASGGACSGFSPYGMYHIPG